MVSTVSLFDFERWMRGTANLPDVALGLPKQYEALPLAIKTQALCKFIDFVFIQVTIHDPFHLFDLTKSVRPLLSKYDRMISAALGKAWETLLKPGYLNSIKRTCLIHLMAVMSLPEDHHRILLTAYKTDINIFSIEEKAEAKAQMSKLSANPMFCEQRNLMEQLYKKTTLLE